MLCAWFVHLRWRRRPASPWTARYTFTGGEGTYQADGKTFIIGAESVVVQEPGLPDRVCWSFTKRKVQQSCW